MAAVRAFENGSLLSSYSALARWDLFRHPLDSTQQFRLLATVMLVVTSLSLAENLAVILVTSKFKQLRQPVNYIIVNLSVADFLVSLTGGTISFLTNLKGIAALWSLAPLAFERYIVICRPLRNTCLKGKHAALGIGFVWSFSFLWTIPPATGWSSYTTSKIGTTCEQNWHCLIQMFSCSATGPAGSNRNLTSERAVLAQYRRGSETAPVAVLSTISKRKTGDEHRSRQSLAMLTTSENKTCAM